VLHLGFHRISKSRAIFAANARNQRRVSRRFGNINIIRCTDDAAEGFRIRARLKHGDCVRGKEPITPPCCAVWQIEGTGNIHTRARTRARTYTIPLPCAPFFFACGFLRAKGARCCSGLNRASSFRAETLADRNAISRARRVAKVKGGFFRIA